VIFRADYAGSSFTSAATGYSTISQQWLRSNHAQLTFTFNNQALSGHNTWSNLARLSTGADLFIIDHANDSKDLDYTSMEALIRRLWTANQSTKIIMISSPSWNGQDTDVDANVETPTNDTQISLYKTFAEYYGITWIDYLDWCKTVVNATTYHLNELTDDTVHPSAIGYQNMATLLEVYLPNGGGSKPSTLPTRLYDSEDLERTPTRLNGIEYTSITGTWTETETRIASSEVNATITFTATCSSFGVYRIDTSNPSVEYSIDGGDYVAGYVSQNGVAIAAGLAEHTITIKVVSGAIRIDEFWAV